MEFVDDSVFSLKQALDCAARAVREALPARFWVVGEIAEMSKRGHMYIDLVQKEAGSIVAKARATIWQSVAGPILNRFTADTGQTLAVGMNAMMLVSCSLHPVYGLGLTVHAINGDFTLGEMAREKREVIDRLTKEGLIDCNKALPFPLVPQRIAVISSASAAGYGDFADQLDRNPFGYRFRHRLFEALLQGDQSERSLIAAIRQVREASADFDVLVVIRGGGSKIDLSCFDTYPLSCELATFPLPVITGIGHERDESVVDMVAHERCKTPTAVAELLIKAVHEFEFDMQEMQTRIVRGAKDRLERCRAELGRCGMMLERAVMNSATLRDRDLRAEEARARAAFQMRMEREKSLLERLSDKVLLLDPINVLKRGYSLVYDGQILIRSVKQTSIDQNLRVRLSDGSIDAQVMSIKLEEEPNTHAI